MHHQKWCCCKWNEKNFDSVFVSFRVVSWRPLNVMFEWFSLWQNHNEYTKRESLFEIFIFIELNGEQFFYFIFNFSPLLVFGDLFVEHTHHLNNRMKDVYGTKRDIQSKWERKSLFSHHSNFWWNETKTISTDGKQDARLFARAHAKQTHKQNLLYCIKVRGASGLE